MSEQKVRLTLRDLRLGTGRITLLFARSQEGPLVGRVDPETSLLSVALVHDERHPKHSLYERFALHGPKIVSHEGFAGFFSNKHGRLSRPPTVMGPALLGATHGKTPDREAILRIRVDFDWRWVMGLDNDFRGNGARTFSLFVSRLLLNKDDLYLFGKTLEKVVEADVLRGQLTAIVNASLVNGTGPVAYTYDLRQGRLAKVLTGGANPLSATSATVTAPHIGEKPNIGWKDKDESHRYLVGLLFAVNVILAEASSIESVAEAVSFSKKVVDREIQDDGHASPQIRNGVTSNRIVSVANRELCYYRRSSPRSLNGYKLDAMPDEKTKLVLRVAVRAGNASDVERTLLLLEQAQRVPVVEIEFLLADMAYSNPKPREVIGKPDTCPLAEFPPLSNSVQSSKTDFAIDIDTPTCPTGVALAQPKAGKNHKNRPVRHSVFPAETCGLSSMRERCVKGQKAGRSIFLLPHKNHMAAARAAHHGLETRRVLAARPSWSARSTTSKASECTRPVTVADERRCLALCLPQRSPTSAAFTSSARSTSHQSWLSPPKKGNPMAPHPRRRCKAPVPVHSTPLWHPAPPPSGADPRHTQIVDRCLQQPLSARSPRRERGFSSGGNQRSVLERDSEFTPLCACLVVGDKHVNQKLFLGGVWKAVLIVETMERHVEVKPLSSRLLAADQRLAGLASVQAEAKALYVLGRITPNLESRSLKQDHTLQNAPGNSHCENHRNPSEPRDHSALGVAQNRNMSWDKYPSDLSDAEWRNQQPIIQAASCYCERGGYREVHHKHDIIDAAVYILPTGCSTHQLPVTFHCRRMATATTDSRQAIKRFRKPMTPSGRSCAISKSPCQSRARRSLTPRSPAPWGRRAETMTPGTSPTGKSNTRSLIPLGCCSSSQSSPHHSKTAMDRA